MPTIAIVGAGFSGVAVAWNLLPQLPAASRLILISNEAVIGRGLAYGSPSPHHLLNVPAARMGIAPDDESGFLRFLQQLGLPFQGGDFVPRNLYGAYLQRVLGEQRALASARQIDFDIRYDEVLAIEPQPRDTLNFSASLNLQCASGAQLQADRVVLALGNFAPRPLDFTAEAGLQTAAQSHLIQNPWQYSTMMTLPVQARVLLLGSGLTAVDVLMQLRHLGHRGKVTMLSRRGLLPQAHRPSLALSKPVVPGDFVANLSNLNSIRQKLAYFRHTLKSHQTDASALDWRDLLAAMRPVSAAMWQGLSDREQARFLRHLQGLWDSHRHRMAAPVADMLHQEVQQHRLQLQAGRLQQLHYAIEPQNRQACWQACWQPRAQSGLEIQHVDWLINCTGPVSALRAQKTGLLAQLQQHGHICADAAGLGLLVEADYQVQATTAQTKLEGLYYIGPLLKAQFWEATAVPELRQHARQLANHVRASLQ